MENQEITNHSELALHIMRLKAEKFSQEESLKTTFRELENVLNPVSLIKESIHQFANDKQIKQDLTKIGVKMGVNFLIDKILGRNNSIKGFLSSVMMENISDSIINNNLYSLFKSKKKESTE